MWIVKRKKSNKKKKKGNSINSVYFFQDMTVTTNDRIIFLLCSAHS